MFLTPTTFCNADGSASTEGPGYAVPCYAIAQVQSGSAKEIQTHLIQT